MRSGTGIFGCKALHKLKGDGGMSLDKAIEHKKEQRKKDSWKHFMHADGCLWCKRNLRHSLIKERARTDEEIRTFADEDAPNRVTFIKKSRRVHSRMQETK